MIEIDEAEYTALLDDNDKHAARIVADAQSRCGAEWLVAIKEHAETLSEQGRAVLRAHTAEAIKQFRERYPTHPGYGNRDK